MTYRTDPVRVWSYSVWSLWLAITPRIEFAPRLDSSQGRQRIPPQTRARSPPDLRACVWRGSGLLARAAARVNVGSTAHLDEMGAC